MRFDGLQADPAAVADHLKNINALLTSGEQTHLQEIVRRIAAANRRAFEIIIEAAARSGGQDPQAVLNAREAGAQFLASLSVPLVLQAMNDAAQKAS